ncbi:death-associated inhibitor of apoptosis 1 [Harpegnathos saltator]|uniref:Apoptosis inhibitor IAP n=1 Tax=Harpegnathos saltator TaxID=610380 RepID=E2BF80_HARSA|nr:death-associated inhibitor of apoptosis 1 [Harpegnathos saltator]XP_011137652.1 death-associated inhibitor of apoptosis 1 [Harpegnathos saltator]XP_025154977.1 death-associated inhibitor of apoptosis 1 [Harpegnathos saltator]EFN85666.1 Apoptosis inhibitor IAP [Harpegnathos saltator]
MTSGMIECRDLGANLKNVTPTPKLMSNTDELTVGVDDVDYTDFRFEAARLDSYANWSTSYVKPKTLAAAGFYYTGKEDAVRCFECRLALRKWSPDDNPWVDHQRFSDKCRFIRGIPCGNVPIGVDPDTIPLPELRSRDLCGVYGIQYRPNAVVDVPVDVYFENTKTPNTISLGELQSAKYPEYANISDRISTFETWPETKVQTKEQLTEAGFYFAKKGDRTICYYCGGGLEDWEPNDVPLQEHIKWFSKCKYALNKLEAQNTNSFVSSRI